MPRMAMAGDTVVVEISQLAFKASRLEITPGTTVRWVNRDPLQHSVTADDGSFDSRLVDPEGAYVRTFNEVGTYDYHCEPHPFMEGTIVVRDGMDAPSSTDQEALR